MKRKDILCLMAAVVFMLSAVQATLAAWRVSDPSTHAISIGSLSGRIVEEYEEQTGVKGGQIIDKVVNVQNTGNADSVVRIKLEKVWGKSRTPEGVLIADISYPTDNIIISCNTEYWYFNEEDGYYYYKGVLSSGQTTVQPLFEKFSIADDISNEYDNMTADIIVRMECLQAAGNAISAVWEMSFEELGVTYSAAESTHINSEVSFIGQNDGFAFTPADTDLFTNFKDLLPGETRTQGIIVKNTSSNDTEIFLRAEVADQTKATPETLELINRLLKEYVTIVVTEENGTEIYNGPVWGKPLDEGSNPETMRYDFSLGKFNAGQTRQLTVSLQVSPEVNNEYQELWGYIRWVWSAEGAETPIVPPQTGDTSNMYFYFGITLCSGFILVMLIRYRQREKNENKKKQFK